MIDLDEVKARYLLARMAGEHVDDAGHGPDEATFRVVAASCQDVPELHDELKILRKIAGAAEDLWGHCMDPEHEVCVAVQKYKKFKEKHSV